MQRIKVEPVPRAGRGFAPRPNAHRPQAQVAPPEPGSAAKDRVRRDHSFSRSAAFGAGMIALDAMQGISVGVVHFRAGGGKLQRQIGNIAERAVVIRSEEHTSELQSLMRISYAVFCLKK